MTTAYGTEAQFRERASQSGGVNLTVRCYRCFRLEKPCKECLPIRDGEWSATFGPGDGNPITPRQAVQCEVNR